MQTRSKVFYSPEEGRAAAAPPARGPGNVGRGRYWTESVGASAADQGRPGYSMTHLDVSNAMNESFFRLMMGVPIVNKDGSYTTPEMFYQRLADQGDPLGLAWVDANSGRAASQLGMNKLPEWDAYQAGLREQASGRQFDASTQGATTALDRQARAAEGMSEGIGHVRRAAEGSAPSAAQMQLTRGVQDAARMQAGQAASLRGGNAAAAFRMAAGAGADMTMRGIGDASRLRAQEMADARGQLVDAQHKQAVMFGDVSRSRVGLGDARDRAMTLGASGLGQAASFRHGVQMDQVAADRAERQRFLEALIAYQNLAHGHAASVGSAEASREAARLQADASRDAATIGMAGSALESLNRATAPAPK